MTSLTYEMKPADGEAFQLHTVLRPGVRRRRRLVWAIAALLLPAVTLGLGWAVAGFRPFTLQPGMAFPALLPSLLCLVAIIFDAPLLRIAVRFNLRRQLKGTTPGVLTGPMRIEATPEGLSLSGERGRGIHDWAAVSALEETPTHIFVLLGPMLGIVVPKRGQSDAALAAFRAEVAARRAAAAS